jgi:hypothetical protein
MLRAVVDTNIFVSSLLSKSGAPAQVIDAWRSRNYLLISCESIIAEIRSVLNSAPIRGKYGLQSQDIEEIVKLLQSEALLVPGEADVSGTIPLDPDDEIFLACALEAQADFIVSGDRHLLTLGEYQGIAILTAPEFLARLIGGSANP